MSLLVGRGKGPSNYQKSMYYKVSTDVAKRNELFGTLPEHKNCPAGPEREPILSGRMFPRVVKYMSLRRKAIPPILLSSRYWYAEVCNPSTWKFYLVLTTHDQLSAEDVSLTAVGRVLACFGKREGLLSDSLRNASSRGISMTFSLLASRNQMKTFLESFYSNPA